MHTDDIKETGYEEHPIKIPTVYGNTEGVKILNGSTAPIKSKPHEKATVREHKSGKRIYSLQ
jgi:hypothetical protein